MFRLIRLLVILSLSFLLLTCGGGDEETPKPMPCNLDDGDFSFSVVENSSAGTEVGMAAITVPEGKILSYTITAGNAGNTFAIDNTGRLTVNNNDELDYEVNQQFDLLIRVTAEDCSDGLVTVSIRVANERDELYADQYFNNIDVQEGVSYGPFGDQVMNLYLPQGEGQTPRPVLVFAGGGAFLGSDLNKLDAMARRFSGAGYVVALVRYITDPDDELDPQERFITGIHDFKAAVRFFRKHAEEGNAYNINPDNIFAGGYGTGAFIALQATYATAEDYSAEELEYLDTLGGVEGERGNNGYSAEVNGVLNHAGAVYFLELIDAGEVPVFSVHSLNDPEVACEISSGGSFATYGSCSIHSWAMGLGLPSEFIGINSNAHDAPVNCNNCHDAAMRFFLEFIK